LKNLKLALLGASFLVGASALSGAYAADVYSRGGGLKDSGPVDYAPAISWTGFYIGAHVGGSFDDALSASNCNQCTDLELDSSFIAGVHVGYNWQTASNLVLGIEGNITFGGFEAEVDGVEGVTTDYLASIRGRLGYAFGNSLVYGTGGVAFLQWGDDIAGLFEDDSSVGWVAGVGFEHKLRQNLSFGVEGLYYAFDENEVIGGDGIELDRDLWTIQARITYHFGGDRHSEALK
jgi:outer membrane immunogenic protein